jgi:hypothetical protein
VAAKRKPGGGLTWNDVRRIALAFPGVEEGTSYGTPAFRASKKFFTRLKEDGQSIVVRIDMEEREILMAADPKTYFITDHYRPWPAMLVNLASAHESQVYRLLEQSWKAMAPKKLLAAYEGRAKGAPALKRSVGARLKR